MLEKTFPFVQQRWPKKCKNNAIIAGVKIQIEKCRHCHGACLREPTMQEQNSRSRLGVKGRETQPSFIASQKKRENFWQDPNQNKQMKLFSLDPTAKEVDGLVADTSSLERHLAVAGRLNKGVRNWEQVWVAGSSPQSQGEQRDKVKRKIRHGSRQTPANQNHNAPMYFCILAVIAWMTFFFIPMLWINYLTFPCLVCLLPIKARYCKKKDFLKKDKLACTCMWSLW